MNERQIDLTKEVIKKVIDDLYPSDIYTEGMKMCVDGLAESQIKRINAREILREKIINRKKIVKVVAALIENDNKYLIARRDTGDINMLGKWEFPGGKVEPNEDELTAIEREIKEEFDLEIKAIRFISNSVCEYPDKIVDLRLYECKYISGDFKLHDHSEYIFVSKKELLDYDLCPADVTLAKCVYETM